MAIAMGPRLSPIDVVLPHLSGVKKTGGRHYVAHCPAHRDSELALEITVGRDGRVVFECSAGCDTPAIAGALGLGVSDLHVSAAPPANGAGPARSASERRLPRVMANEAAEQAVLAAAMIEPTAIEHALPIVDWQMFFSDRHRLIFKAMTLLAVTATVIDPVTLSDALASSDDLERAGGKDYIGFLVDAVPTAANITYHAGIVREWAMRRRLLGTMDATATLLRDGGADVRGAAELARQVAAELEPLAAAVEGELPAPVCAFTAPEPEPITWCVEDLLVAGEVAVLGGDGGSYKSTGALHMAAAVAGGYSAFSRFPTTRRPALILSAEDGRGIVLNRLEAIVAGHGWDRERVLSNVHVIATHDAKLSSPTWQQHLLAACLRLDVGFVVFDPWADLISGEENSNSEQRPVIHFCRRIATQTNAATVVVAHAAKVRDGQRAIDRIRGAAALRDAARCVLFFESRPEGIAIEHLKMSRAEKLEPFTLSREIEASPDSRTTWTTARFVFQSTDEAILSRAETFVLDQVTAFPGALKSADLRSRGAAAGINYEGIAKALTRLQARNLLDFTPGPKNAKLWTPILHSVDSGSALGRLPEPAQYAGSALGRLPHAPEPPASLSLSALPEREAGRQGARGSGEPTHWADESAGDLEHVEIPEEFDL